MERKARKHSQSPDLNQTKVTPRTRATHQAAHSGQLISADPEKKYVLCSYQDNHPMNYKYYESMGYEIEKAVKDGPRIQMGEPVQIGEPLKWMGCVLMSCSKARAEEIFMYGENGLTGQAYYDKLMKKIKANDLEKRISVSGTEESTDISELEQNPDPTVFR